MKTYSKASSDVEKHIERMLKENHPDLEKVTIGALLVHDEESGDQVLKHQGYPAAAVVSVTPLKSRALGVADAIIVVDRAFWLTLSAPQKDALIDHELTHVKRVVDEETEEPKFDAVDRPKLAMRPHDHQLGWFDEVARRHGEASPEIRQARALLEQTKQLYFDFGQVVAARTLPDGPLRNPERVKRVKGKRGNGGRVGAH
jgi:hypothetical protein